MSNHFTSNKRDSSLRLPYHQGTWYSNHEKELRKQLENWLNLADLAHGPARAIIAPHAAYQYCGDCSAFGYRQISPAVVQRIFILGPSHHCRIYGCALSVANKYKTPLYDLRIDRQVYQELEATDRFVPLYIDDDEHEHSIEMQLPYIAKVMEGYKDQFTIVPVLVGSLSPEQEAEYGRIFARYLAEPQNLFIISSDFCHWGQRFRYNYYEKSWGSISQSITRLDKMGMDIIESLNPASFTEYLKRYGNTICGRHPIGVFLQAVSYLQKEGNAKGGNFKFLKYSQSSQCETMSDSSVSYAAGALTFE